MILHVLLGSALLSALSAFACWLVKRRSQRNHWRIDLQLFWEDTATFCALLVDLFLAVWLTFTFLGALLGWCSVLAALMAVVMFVLYAWGR